MQDAGKAGKPPISTHPLFPAIVALWFAALLGLGTLIVPVALLESAVTATGIAAVIPPAAPPLGLTARILMALAATLVGTVAGLQIGRRVASAHKGETTPRFSQTVAVSGTPRPIKAHEELGEEGFDGKPLGRRRMLAIEKDDSPGETAESMPLPGAQELSWPAEDETIGAGDTLELSAIVGEAHGPIDDRMAEEFATPEPEEPAPAAFSRHAGDEGEPMTGPPDFDPPDEEDMGRQEFIPGKAAQYETPAGPEMADSALAEPAEAPQAEDESAIPAPPEQDWGEEEEEEEEEVLPFSPPSLSPGKQLETAPAHSDAGDVPEEPQPEAEPGDDELAENDMSEQTVKDWSEAPPEELGLVQLAQRLGAAIEKRREYVATRAAAEPVPQRNIPSGFDVAEPDEAAQAKAAYFGGGQPGPAVAQDQAPTGNASGKAAESAHEAPAFEPEPGDMETGRRAFQPAGPTPADTMYRPFAGFGPAQSGAAHEEEEHEIDDLAASFSLPIDRPASQPLAGQDTREEASPDAESTEVEAEEHWQEEPGERGESPAVPQARAPEGYGSLLGMKNPVRESGDQFVRIEETESEGPGSEEPEWREPSVVFPGQEAETHKEDESQVAAARARSCDPPRAGAERPARPAAPKADNSDTDEMLREALLKLQRTSGAA